MATVPTPFETVTMPPSSRSGFEMASPGTHSAETQMNLGAEISASNTNEANAPRAKVASIAALRSAIRAQAQGEHELALEQVENLLQRFPANTQALLLAGQSCLMLQQPAQALVWLDRLIHINPCHAMALNNRGAALEALNRPEDALPNFIRARELEPDYEDACLNEAQCLQRLGRHALAQRAYERVLHAEPKHALARVGLGQTLCAQGQFDAGLRELQRVVDSDAQNGWAWNALGDVLLQAGRWQAAVDAYGQASNLLPQHALLYANCSKALRELQAPEEALLVCEAALSIDPDCLPALRNKAVFLMDLSRWTLAIEACAHVLNRSPEDAQAHNNLGFALNALRQYPAALDAFQTAARCDPKLTIAWVNQACTLELMHRHEEAWQCCEEALKLQPDYPNLLGRLGHARMYVCEWTDEKATRERLLSTMREGQAPCDPFRIITFSDRAEDQQQLARRWLQELPKPAGDWPALLAKPRGKRLRVGYFSADFHHHATTLLMMQLLELHDRDRFEIIAYSFGVRRQDEMRARVIKACDAFHDILGMDDDAAATLARSHELDVAVDLKGYTMDHRLGLFQRRVAPVQISYLGFPGTVGAPFMDYILADYTVIPDELRRHYDEKVIRVPGTYQANDATRAVPSEGIDRKTLGLPEDGFVFCCFNNNYKITPDVFDIWMRLLRQTPGSVLWLLADSDAAVSNLRRHAQDRGIEPARIVFAPRVPVELHLARQRAADLFLDTLPCNAHTTASDALRVGLPVLTCAGTSFASRVAASLLAAQGLHELITNNLADYEATALELAHNSERLRALRHRALEAVSTGAMLATEQLTRSIEAAYVQTHARAATGLQPDHIDI